MRLFLWHAQVMKLKLADEQRAARARTFTLEINNALIDL